MLSLRNLVNQGLQRTNHLVIKDRISFLELVFNLDLTCRGETVRLVRNADENGTSKLSESPEVAGTNSPASIAACKSTHSAFR